MQSLQILPGVGAKTAQRMAFHLLQNQREAGSRLAEVMARSLAEIGQCRECRTLTEAELCPLCQNPKRDERLLCIVESPSDIVAIERAGGYEGRYFVLHGRLSPIDGIGPEELGLSQLEAQVRRRRPREAILATNPTVEGEATAFHIHELIRDQVERITRIAHGVPIGGELDYVDGGTLAHALQGRRRFR